MKRYNSLTLTGGMWALMESTVFTSSASAIIIFRMSSALRVVLKTMPRLCRSALTPEVDDDEDDDDDDDDDKEEDPAPVRPPLDEEEPAEATASRSFLSSVAPKPTA
jgi:hypothetical protein